MIQLALKPHHPGGFRDVAHISMANARSWPARWGGFVVRSCHVVPSAAAVALGAVVVQRSSASRQVRYITREALSRSRGRRRRQGGSKEALRRLQGGSREAPPGRWAVQMARRRRRSHGTGLVGGRPGLALLVPACAADRPLSAPDICHWQLHSLCPVSGSGERTSRHTRAVRGRRLVQHDHDPT